MYLINKKIFQTPVENGNRLLLEPTTGIYYEMNEISVLIYQCIADGCDQQDILKMILDKYEIDENQAKNDLTSHIDELLKQNILIESSVKLS
jgi:hypothetical protein